MGTIRIGDLNSRLVQITMSGPHPETRFTLQGGTVESYNIVGTLDRTWMVANGFYDDGNSTWLKTIVEVDIGTTVTSIDTGAFWDCTAMTRACLPTGVTTIGQNAFHACRSLVEVNIPTGVTTIE